MKSSSLENLVDTGQLKKETEDIGVSSRLYTFFAERLKS